jgi:hypothetical protein
LRKLSIEISNFLRKISVSQKYSEKSVISRVLGITTLNKINLNTETSLGNYTTKMTIDTGRNLGIGTNNPKIPLTS